MKSIGLKLTMAAGIIGWLSAGALAGEVDPGVATPVSVISAGDTTWVLLATALVMFMTPGLAFFYGGLVRKKNILSVLMQCFMMLCLISVQWVLVGY